MREALARNTASSSADGHAADVSADKTLDLGHRSEIESIREGGPLFDSEYYVRRYRDIEQTGTDPHQHYVSFGKSEGRHASLAEELRSIAAEIPSIIDLPQLSGRIGKGRTADDILFPWFDPDYYRARYADVADDDHLLLHYLRFGAREGRAPSALFDTEFYAVTYPDVTAAQVNPLLHFLARGAFEGRFASAEAQTRAIVSLSGYLDLDWYRETYGDVAASHADPLAHYLEFGAHEGRQPSALFDAERYLRENADVASLKLNPIEHWVRYGRREGRNSPETSNSLMSLHELCDPTRREAGAGSIAGRHLISIISPVYNTKASDLRELHRTIENQTYAEWEWIVVDDGSTSVGTLGVLKELAASARVTVISQPNGGISAASNAALAAARGEYVALVDHDDLLARTVLAEVAAVLEREALDLVYTDECKLSEKGKVYGVSLKPDWSPILLLNTMYIGHLSVYRTSFAREIGGFRSRFDGTQDYDLALRASERPIRCRHVDVIGYLWRATPGSTALSLDEKSYAVARQKLALEDHLERTGKAATVGFGASSGSWRVEYALPDDAPLVSVVIPTAGGSRVVRGQRRDLVVEAVDSLVESAFFARCEIVVVHNGDLSDDQLEALERHPQVVLRHYDRPQFNLAEKINIGVASARGEYVLLINDDIEIVTPGGGDKLLGFMLANPAVGIASCLCLYENGTVQHNGVIGLEQGPSHYGIGRPLAYPGAPLTLQYRRECMAVTGAFMMFKASLYEALGGYREDLPINYNDVDFCLRLQAKGLRCVVDPTVSIYHYESSSELGGQASDIEVFHKINGTIVDRHFNRAFDQNSPHLEFRSRKEPPPFASPDVFGPWLNRRIGQRGKSGDRNTATPRLSVGIPVFNQPARLLSEALRSIRLQSHPAHEILIVDDCSTAPDTLVWLDRLVTTDRLRLVRHERNLGIAGANRTLLANATGDFLLPIDADDFVTIDALEIMAEAIRARPDANVFYSDEFKSDMRSQKFSPFFKPAFDPILLTNCCYPTHLMAIRTTWLRAIGAYEDDRATWCHDLDVLTRSVGRGDEPVHVPELLYAWRINPGSTASAETGTKPHAFASQEFVLRRLLDARGVADDLDLRLNPLFDPAAMWMLDARRPLAGVAEIDVRRLWSTPATARDELAAAARQASWIFLSTGSDAAATLLRLSAPVHYDPGKVAACGGLLLDARGRILWSGGFVPDGTTVYDPYADGIWGEGSGYHGQLFCQRRVDVLTPFDMVVRADVLRDALALCGSLPPMPDALAVAIAIATRRRDHYAVVTPHVRAVLPKGSSSALPIDGAGLLRAHGFESSGLYRNALSREVAYGCDLHPTARDA